MIKLLKRMAVRTKLLSSFLILASLVLLLGLTAIFLQQKLEKNQNDTLASINLTDAFFEGKYFLRSDMHIFTELMRNKQESRLSYWWGEHDFQIQFFNDQLVKIENEFLINHNFENDTLQNRILAIVASIRNDYEKKMLPVFAQFRTLKNEELALNNRLQHNENIDSLEVVRMQNRLERIHEVYAEYNQEITDIGLGIITQLDEGKDLVRVLTINIQEHGKRLMDNVLWVLLIFTTFGVIFSIAIALYISKLITRPVKKILKHVDKLGHGEHPDSLQIKVEDEFGKIQKSLNALTHSLISTSEFSKEIGEGNFESEYQPMSKNDVLGNSLMQMRNSLKKARQEEEKRRLEDERRSWASNGIARFSEIMRQSGDDLKTLSYRIMSNLIDYLEATQGALFVINEEDDEDTSFELISAIAYGRDKFMHQQIKMGEGLVGRAAFEEKTIYLKEIPENYVKISSGLGDSNPRTILIVPVKLEDKVNGVIELISFNEFENYQIEFVEKVGENISSFISSIKINEKTANLLAESKQQSEELAAQEEEMRQNMEELQATQEEAARREEERNALWDSIGKLTGLVEMDLSGTISTANNYTGKLLGVPASNLIDKAYQQVFLSNFKGDAQALFLKVQKGEVEVVESKWESEGVTMSLEHRIGLVYNVDGKPIKILSMLTEAE